MEVLLLSMNDDLSTWSNQKCTELFREAEKSVVFGELNERILNAILN